MTIVVGGDVSGTHSPLVARGIAVASTAAGDGETQPKVIGGGESPTVDERYEASRAGSTTVSKDGVLVATSGEFC